MNADEKQETQRRLIVLIPDCLADNMELAHKIHWMAIRDHCDVYFLTLVDEEDKLLAVSRCMTTMKAVTAGNWLVVNTKLTETKAWLKTLMDIYRPGDIIVCQEEQSVNQGLFKTVPVSEYLWDTLKVPVTTLSGYYHPEQVQVRNWLRGLLFWIGCLVIFAVFTLLEMQMDIDVRGLAHTTVLIFLVIFEVGAIWTWGSISR